MEYRLSTSAVLFPQIIRFLQPLSEMPKCRAIMHGYPSCLHFCKSHGNNFKLQQSNPIELVRYDSVLSDVGK